MKKIRLYIILLVILIPIIIAYHFHINRYLQNKQNNEINEEIITTQPIPTPKYVNDLTTFSLPNTNEFNNLYVEQRALIESISEEMENEEIY